MTPEEAETFYEEDEDPQKIFNVFKYIKERYGNVTTGHEKVYGWYDEQKKQLRDYHPEGDNSDGVAIVSGGLDSITTVYHLVRLGRRPHMVSFDYGQRHAKELQYALWNAEKLGLRWSLIDLTSMTDLISNSALTSKETLDAVGALRVPEGHYAEDNMRITVVPNRNMVMFSIAAAIAVNAKYKYIAAGMHAGDHYQYPDCRPVFMHAMLEAMQWGNEGFIEPNFKIEVPFIHLSKADIADEAYRCGVPLHQTWSCYKGGEFHCGKCGTCVERLEAIASVTKAPKDWDQTGYEDVTFWKQAVATH
jgi:7-cyano-7-deazaguanine synthase